jgi:CDP-archaeol synthase
MDQLDFVIGSLLLIAPFVHVSLSDVTVILMVSFAGDIVVNHLSYALGIRDTQMVGERSGCRVPTEDVLAQALAPRG